MKPISFQTYLEPQNKVGYCHITVPQEIVDKVGGFGSRLLCTVNGNETIHSGLMGKGDGRGIIIINKNRQKNGASISVMKLRQRSKLILPNTELKCRRNLKPC